MQQWVRINYPGDREVLMDGTPFGPTNRKLPANEGTHTFTLEGPADYEPPFDERLIADSSEEFPIEIKFRRRRAGSEFRKAPSARRRRIP